MKAFTTRLLAALRGQRTERPAPASDQRRAGRAASRSSWAGGPVVWGGGDAGGGCDGGGAGGGSC